MTNIFDAHCNLFNVSDNDRKLTIPLANEGASLAI